jgi:hypothetical protein
MGQWRFEWVGWLLWGWLLRGRCNGNVLFLGTLGACWTITLSYTSFALTTIALTTITTTAAATATFGVVTS